MSQALKRYIIVCGITVAVFLILAALLASAMGDGEDSAGIEGVQVSSDASAVLSEGTDYGFDSFARANRGTAKLYSGDYYGYRYPLVSRDAVSVVVTDTTAIVFIPESVSSALGIDIQDKAFQSAFEEMLVAIDSASANGGQALKKVEPAYLFTGESEVTLDGFTFRYGQEVEESVYYTTVFNEGLSVPTKSDPGDDAAAAKKAALYAESFKLLPADQVNITGKAVGLDALAHFFSTLDWRPLWVSIKATAIAMIFIFILGLLAAWATIRMSNRWKGIVDTILTIPMVLPPTVCGFLLMLLFGPSTGFGRWLIAHGVDLVFTFPAVVISCFVVAFPLMYRTARGAFESIDTNMLDAARTLGWKESRIFRTLMMPLTWPSIAAGTVLAFARSMGEFGATLFFAGNYAGVTQTIPIAIYFDWMAGDKDAAIFWVGVVILISFLVILFVNTYSARTQKWKKPAAGPAGRADKSYGSESR
ncbi:MAG: molybdate ABC transporter permease subunit [Coriobacteriia bacterium]|nr:molybdate ABC transporter permease subunit [Coriobacteriia bacterium]